MEIILSVYHKFFVLCGSSWWLCEKNLENIKNYRLIVDIMNTPGQATLLLLLTPILQLTSSTRPSPSAHLLLPSIHFFSVLSPRWSVLAVALVSLQALPWSWCYLPGVRITWSNTHAKGILVRSPLFFLIIPSFLKTHRNWSNSQKIELALGFTRFYFWLL